MKKQDQNAIHASVEPYYRTGDPLYLALDREFEFTIDCAADAASSKCARYFGPDSLMAECRDALDSLKWESKVSQLLNYRPVRLAGFINPPFSRKLLHELHKAGQPEEVYRAFDIERWAARCFNESYRSWMTVVGVFPAGIQTKWWAAYVHNRAREVRLLPHRETFLNPDGTPAPSNAGVNTCVIVWAPYGGRMVGGFRTNYNYWSYRQEKL